MQEYQRNEQEARCALSEKNAAPREYADLLGENERLKEACEKARNNGAIYSRIAQTLARDCTDLYYVNVETDEYIEFHTDDGRGALNEVRKGSDFFES